MDPEAGSLDDGRIGHPGLLSAAIGAASLPLGLVAVLWTIEIADRILPGDWERAGIEPRTDDGLLGVVLAPLLHADWSHLISNTVPLLVLGFLLATAGPRTFASVTTVIWLAGGVAVWLFAGADTLHIGASGVVFGWIGFLVTRGVFSRSVGQIVIGIAVLVLYGSTLLGVLPGQEGISWQGHLFGAVAGICAAWAFAERRSVE